MGIFFDIFSPVVAIGGLGILFGLGLGFAGKIFHVDVDENIEKIQELLPGANCGGCGFAGCGAFATAVVEKKAPPNGCPVGGATATEKIIAILGAGSNTGEHIRKTAFVKCAGSWANAESRYEYSGIDDCLATITLAGGGAKACIYGCLGNATCVRVCKFDAISIVDGVAIIDKEKCKECGICVKACPRNLIELIPYDSTMRVACASHDTGKIVRENCKVGCIGCKICQKACKFDAIHIADNISSIDYEKCTNCGDCSQKCPMKSII